ncbi:penicillin-binding protein 2 [Agaribacterium haliotis]|uniref:penicillin-binding protein 2 n=1 Tax=Agaribacterium haliotis TaxID=2013869 RepID=UPI000BB530AE|nr:penicillin-binding protein 2 [Agaribacterium haliotis]
MNKSAHESDHHQFKDHAYEQRLFKRRVVVSLVLVFAALTVLIFRFHDLQIKQHRDFVTQSDNNRIQLRPVAPNRGLLIDARGRIIAENKAVSTLSIVVERVENLDETLAELGKLVDISERNLENFHKALKWRRRPYQPVALKYNLSDEELARIAVNEHRLDGVELQGQLVRYYPYAELFSHVGGYVGRIDEREQNRFDDEQKRLYAGTDSIGKIGLEKFYESVLLGSVGQEKIETNARGRALRVVDAQPPQAGSDIELFLDVDVQKAASEAMAGRRGAVVAIDVDSGGVVAMLSAPAFDPNLFVTGISSRDYRALNDNLDLPLFNRSIQAQYPPGSTLKPMLGLGGLEYGIISEFTRVPDPGWYQLENDERLYRDWKRGGHGAKVGLHQAIVESCDVFFYDLGKRMGVDKMHEFGNYFGLGQHTNIDVPSERKGLWPSRAWKKNVRGLNWYPGNSLNMSIGQGDVLATPLQLAAMTVAMANKGRFIEPRLAKSIAGESTQMTVRSTYEGKDANWAQVLKGMKDVVHSPRGTAQSLNRDLNFTMAGKTGTAQVVSIAQEEEYDSEALLERHRDHALFVGFAPAENPRIAVAVVIENGEKSSEAGAVAKAVMKSYLTNRFPLEFADAK